MDHVLYNGTEYIFKPGGLTAAIRDLEADNEFTPMDLDGWLNRNLMDYYKWLQGK